MIDQIEPVKDTFHPGWQQWLAENLIRGVQDEKIAAVLLKNGFDEAFISQQMDVYHANPIMIAARKSSGYKDKLISLLEVLGDVFKQSEYAENFKKHENLSSDEFYEKYFYCNRPVVIKGLMKDWPAMKIWDAEYFAETFGDVEVEITSGRSSDPFFEDNFVHHRKKIMMKEYIDSITSVEETNDVYLVAKNNLLAMHEFNALNEHFTFPEGFLDPAFSKANYVKLWLGPKGTLTPLHHDAGNIFFGQIRGRKHIKLIPPYDISRVYNNRTCFSEVDLENIDYERFPLMHLVTIIDVVLEPGEFILFPVGWWHWVKSLDMSISLSFQNFYYKGSNIIWKHAVKY